MEQKPRQRDRRIIPRVQEKTRNKKVTIAAGFCCTNGIVLCADRQFTTSGLYKYHDKKIITETGDAWSATFAFSGSPVFADEIRQKVVVVLNQKHADEIRAPYVQEVLDDVLTSTSRLYISGEIELQLLVGLAVLFESPELLHFDGRALRIVENGCAYVGGGETSIVRYLSDLLYSPSLSTAEASSLAAYLVKKTEQYVDGVGGPIDVVVLNSFGECEWLPEATINERITRIEKRERQIFDLLIRQPSASSNEP
jgi:20S proteasome alpha/beta subunit